MKYTGMPWDIWTLITPLFREQCREEETVRSFRCRHSGYRFDISFLSPHYGGVGGIRTHGPLRIKRFRVLSSSVTYMVSPVSFSQPCTPANPHKIWIFREKRPEIRRNRPSVPISDFSAFGKNCGKNGKNKNEKAIHGQFECRQSLSRYEVYCHERNRNQLGRCSRCDHEGSAVSHLPYQQIHRPIPAPKRENPLRVHGQENTLLQNQKGGCHCLSGKPQGLP